MARVTHAQSIGEVAKTIGENLELLQVVTANSDNIDYGEMIWVDDGTEEGIKTLSDRGIECLVQRRGDATANGGVSDGRACRGDQPLRAVISSMSFGTTL